MFHKAQHERMAPGMAFQMVCPGLLDVADVSHAQGASPDGEVQREELAHGRLVVQGGERDVPPEILVQRHFIIRLAVFR